VIETRLNAVTSLDWPDVPPQLRGEGVSLRGWRPDDADAVYRACQAADIQRWTTVPRPYLREHADGFVGAFAAEQWANHAAARFAVMQADAVVGSCGLVHVDAAELVAEVGYWVAPWARGRGVGASALPLLSAWALDAGGLQRLEALIEPANAASCAVATASGFALEGVLRSKVVVSGERRDIAMYARLGAPRTQG
jgi:RimJ/RimL family protein N-acetyltransferase